LEFIHTIRGKSGGMLLAIPPEEINLATVVRLVEPHMNLLECFDDETNTCPITNQCGLKGLLFQARKGFLDVLDAHTLADLLPSKAIHSTTQAAAQTIPIEVIQAAVKT